MFDRDCEILTERLHEQRRTANRIGSVQLTVPEPGNSYIEIPHERVHVNLLVFTVDGEQNHGV